MKITAITAIGARGTDVANAAEHLASDRLGFTSGQRLLISGGGRLDKAVSAKYRATSLKENEHEQSRLHVGT